MNVDIHIYVCIHAAVAAKSLQLCPTLCNPIDSSPPDSPVPGIFQARTLERGATDTPITVTEINETKVSI